MEDRQKRMLFRAWHRGFKEMDLILGSFADRRLSALNPEQLDQFEAILDAEDTPLYQWIAGKEEMPSILSTPIMAEICDFATLADILREGRSG